MDSFVSWLKDASYGKDMKDIYVIGDGMQFGSCLEGQLKLMETMCMPTMFNDILEFFTWYAQIFKYIFTCIVVG